MSLGQTLPSPAVHSSVALSAQSFSSMGERISKDHIQLGQHDVNIGFFFKDILAFCELMIGSIAHRCVGFLPKAFGCQFYISSMVFNGLWHLFIIIYSIIQKYFVVLFIHFCLLVFILKLHRFLFLVTYIIVFIRVLRICN